ncbi:MAG TPA: LytTR family DNA-binding domain-containing protein [Chitinophagales bacterium]|nr:LytTR family DNA-binding domain-containing protein [Chitinophagales bacterium]
MRNVPVRDRIIPLSFDSKSGFDKQKERIVIYPKVSDIVMIEGDDNYSNVYFTTAFQKSLSAIHGSNHLRISKTLKYFEERLDDFGCFFRCSRGAIINLYHVSLLKYRCVYLSSLDRVVYLSADSVNTFKRAMDRI